jgi:hypothetical protein
MKQKPDRGDSFCWFFCFQPCSAQAAVKAIIVPIRDTDLTTVPGRIMEEVQSWSQWAIARTTAVPDTGMAACIMSGSPVTGHGGMGGKCGSVAITSREDTKPLPVVWRRRVSGLPGRDQATQQTEKSAGERFKKIMAP